VYKSLIRRASGVTRFLDLKASSNRFVLAASFISAGLVTILQKHLGKSATLSGALGLQAGVSVFLSWAIARELDPDSPISAVLAACLGFAIFLTGPSHLVPLTAVLFAVRLMVRSTGAPPTGLDLVWLAALAAHSASVREGLPPALSLGASLVIDTQLPRPASPSALVVGIVLVPLTLLTAAHRGVLRTRWIRPTTFQWTVVMAALAVAAIQIPPPASTDDAGEELIHQRLVWGTWLGVVTGIITALWIGGPAIPGLGGLWAGLTAVGASRHIKSAAT
jgi:hypothetical protein